MEYKKMQEAVVIAISQSLNEAWLRVVVNYEMQYHDTYIEHDRLGFCIRSRADGELFEGELEFIATIERAFVDLNNASLDVNGQHWTVCDLVIDSDGTYEMKFSYDNPKRINAIVDEESYFRFSKYLETYKATQTRTKPDGTH